MQQQGLLDLTQLDAVAAHLDLVIQPSQKLDLAIGQVARQVATAVQARPRHLTDGVGPEALGRAPRPLRLAGASARVALNSEAVSHAVVTCCCWIRAPMRAGVGRRSGNRTQRAPCSKAPHSSKVEASKEMGAMCKSVRLPSRRAYSTPNSRRVMLRWQISTPLGWPVEPEVYIT